MLTDTLFSDRKANPTALLNYGFELIDGRYVYQTTLAKGQMLLTVTIEGDDVVKTDLLDNETGEKYVLHLLDNATGSYVGQLNEEYEMVLRHIEASCFDKDLFQSNQARQLIEYARRTHGDELEYLWDKFPKYAVLRRKDSRKWYGILLTVTADRLGFNSTELIEILDLRIDPDELTALIDDEKYFFGYHMNKRHWLTICLNGSVPTEEIIKRLDKSYELATKNSSNRLPASAASAIMVKPSKAPTVRA